MHITSAVDCPKAYKAILTRTFAQMLYEAPSLHTGMVSVNLVLQKLNDFSTKPCAEHHRSRQRGGRAIVALIERSITLQSLPRRMEVADLITNFCQVHYTTVEENTKLRTFQRTHTSESAYAHCGIQLIEAGELFTKRGHSMKWKDAMVAKYLPIVTALLRSTSTTDTP